MRISHFFIDRPIFATVVSVVIVILGAVAFSRLPIAQYPNIVPPVINISGQYPGANAEVVASTVVAPIEEQVFSPVRTDDAEMIWGQRLNVWTSIVVFLLGLWIIWSTRRRAQHAEASGGTGTDPDDPPASAGHRPR